MASKKEGVTRLRSVQMFAELSQRDLGRIWDNMKLVEHAPGHRIVVEGKSGHGFHLILDGEVTVERKGKRLKLGPNDFFGEMSLIDDGPRTATVTAATPVTTAALSSGGFRSLAKKSPEMMWKLLVTMTQRLREEQSITASLTS